MWRNSILLMCLFLVLSGCSAGNPVAWWKSVNAKARDIATVQARYEVLEKEFARLKKENFALENELGELKARAESQELAKLNLQATGSVTGRRPASINYKIPNGLKPEELQALAYEHFNEKRFAEAAVTFEAFLTQPEAAVIQDANAAYSAGVAWFQIGNFKKAKEHLEAARAMASGEAKEKVRKKVDLWMRVIDRQPASNPHGG